MISLLDLAKDITGSDSSPFTLRMRPQVGKRKTPVTILGGSVVRVWGALEGVLQRHEHSLSRSDRTMRAVHVSFPDGSLPLIGVLWPSDCQRWAVHVSLPDRPLPLIGVLWHSDCQRRAVHVSLPDWPLPLMGVFQCFGCQHQGSGSAL